MAAAAFMLPTGTRGFVDAINCLREETFETEDPESLTDADGDIQSLNIPESQEDNMCYCTYFKKPE